MRCFGIWLATSSVLVGCSFSGGTSQPTIDGGVPDATIPLDDGGMPAPDAGVGPNCGSPGSFIDNFGSDSNLWFPLRVAADTSPEIFEIADGVLRIPLATTLRGASSLFAVDMRNAAVSFRVDELLAEQTSASIQIATQTGVDATFQFGGSGGGTLSTRSPSGSTQIVEDYQAAEDRNMRFRLDGVDLLYELKRNGDDWREIRRIPGVDPIDYRYTLLEVQAVAINGVSVGTTFAIDDFNADAEVTPWCDSGNLDDDFANNLLDPVWFPLLDANCLQTAETVESGGQVVFDSALSSDTRCALFSSPAYNFGDDGAVTLEIPPDLVTNNEYRVFFRLTSRLGTYVSIRLQNNNLCAFSRVDGAVEGSLLNCNTYDPAEVFWRISVNAGNVILEASPNNVDWNAIDQDLLPFPSSQIDVGFGIDLINTSGETSFSVESIESR